MERTIEVPCGMKIDVAKMNEKYPHMGINAVHTLAVPRIEAVLREIYGEGIATDVESVALPNRYAGSKLYINVRGYSEIDWVSAINEVQRQYPEYAGCIRILKENKTVGHRTDWS